MSPLIDLVRKLADAENRADSAAAGEFLAPDFVALARRTGAERDRGQLLGGIARPPTPNPVRTPGDFAVWESAGLGVVWSLVTTTDPTTGAEMGRSCNVHVFRKVGEGWACFDWQVTEMEDSTPTA